MERKWSFNGSDSQSDSNIGVFLDNFEIYAKKIQQKQQKLKKEFEDASKPVPDEKPFGLQVEKKASASKSDKELLYIEALYTIQHKIGRTIDGHSDYINDLYLYVQDAFKVASDQHEKLLAKAIEEKAPVLILNVEVVEALNLEAKDANGFSDPYCMLGIVPGNRTALSDDNNSASEDELPVAAAATASSRRKSKSESHSKSFIRRLSSLRRSDKHHGSQKTKQKTGAIRDGQLPAKYIQTTDVKKATLNPVWMEKFRFKIDSIDTDMLHLDIWDHDDEFSVFDAARKLNEVKGFKGLDRYFKQIAQSARTNKADKDSHVDDFLGAINITLNNIPSNGIDKWFDLEGRTEKSNVEGKIRLKLNLATREDRGNLEDDSYTELKQHQQLMEIFIGYAVTKFKGSNHEWKGELGREAETILHQHAIQGDLTPLQLQMCRWISYCKMHLEHQLSYKLLLQILEQLDSMWKPTSTSRAEVDSLRESFTSIVNHCFHLLGKLRDVFPVSSKQALEKLEYALRLMSKIYTTEAYKQCCPFQNSITHEISQIVKTGTIHWFERVTKQQLIDKNEEDNIKKLVDIANIVILDSYFAVKYYKPIFEKELNFQYFSIVFKKLDHELFNLINKTFYEEFGDEMAIDQSSTQKESGKIQESGNISPKADTDPNIETLTISSRPSICYGTVSDQTALSYFELYVSFFELTRFKGYIGESDRASLKISRYHELFLVPLKRWIELIKFKLDNRILKLSEIERAEAFNDISKYSSSCLELANYMNKIGQFWKLIDWPDQKGAAYYSSKLSIDVSKSCIRYATMLVEIHQSEQILLKQSEQKESTSPDQKSPNTIKRLEQLKRCCIFINNIEKIRESLQLLQYELDKSKEKKTGEKTPRSSIDTTNITLSSNDSQLVLIDHLVENLIKIHLQAYVESHLFYFCESPENVPAQESISRLLQYLDSSLVNYRDFLMQVNFEKLLKFLWIRIIEALKTNIRTEKKRSLIFLNKTDEAVNLLCDFLNADNQGSNKDTYYAFDVYKDFKKIIKVAQTETNKLILLYYQEMVAIQNSIKSGDSGKLFARAYYHTKDETLCVEVIKCKNLLPMDQNGLSDPYVEVELKPRYIFPNCEKQTTTIVKKSLNPSFDEKFEFKIPEKLCMMQGTVIHFTVMDHDLMWSNDFEGEAFVELCSVPGVHGDLGDGGYQDLKYYELYLIQPKSYQNRIWEELESRIYDKVAVDFVKMRKDKVKS